jgi:ubiquinone/menaquinone biosynthesis C-methylase UbiE
MVKQRIIEGGAIVDSSEMDAEVYSAIMGRKLRGEYQEFVQRIIKELQPPKNGRVLEVGSGPGWIGIWLAKERTDLHVDCLEPSSDMIRVATKNAAEWGVGRRVRYIAGYVENMEMIPGKTYDIVVSNDSLHHWVDPKHGLQEIRRVLKQCGGILIQDGRRDLGVRAKFVVNVLGRIMAGKMLRYWKESLGASYTPEEIRRLLDDLGYDDWKVREYFLGLSVERQVLST